MININTSIILKKSCLILFLIILYGKYIFPQSGEAKSLTIGNVWIYSVTYDTLLRHDEVVGDTIFHDLNYAVIKQTLPNSNHIENFYERVDSTKLYGIGYSLPDTAEILLVDFNLNVGDSLNGYLVTDKSIFSIWGESLQEMNLVLDLPGLIHYDDCYIERIGLVSRDAYGPALGGGYYEELKAALIDNKIYGDSTLLDVKIPKNIVPSKFLLFQNYPNPFNPETVISYMLSVSSNVKITVYDILGKEIATLIDEYQKAGEHKVEFNADKYGLSSGIYFYKLKIKGGEVTKKMTYLK